MRTRKQMVSLVLAAVLVTSLAAVSVGQMSGMSRHDGMGAMMGMGGMMQGGMGMMHRPGQPITVMMNGRRMQFDTPPMMMGDRVMVPMRGVFESLGARVHWNGADQTVTAEHEGRDIMLTVGKPMATVNNGQVRLDAAPQTQGGRVYVPLRFVSEAMGANVKWNASAHQVAISTGTATASRPARRTAVTPAAIAQGKRVYSDNNCAACHQIHGEGGTVGPDLTHVGAQLDEAAIEKQVKNGGGGMPPFPRLSQRSLDALAGYLKSLE